MLEPTYSAIDKAIRENRFGERLLYALSTLITITGIFAIIYGTIKGEGLVALSGSIATALIFPAFREAREIRRQNIAIRLLEASLTIAETSEEAARAINDAFQQVFIRANRRI
jgi:hypothetical protein